MNNTKHKITGERISEYSDKNSFIEQLSIYHFFLKQINLINPKLSNSEIMDCACGTGYGIDFFYDNLDKSNKLTGVDIDVETIEICKDKYKNKEINFIVGSILDEKLVQENSIYLYLCNQTLEHFYKEDQLKVVENQYKLIKKGGYLMLCVPNKPVYQKFDPSNPYHLNELDFENFEKIITSQKWQTVNFFGQKTPIYQQGNGLRSNFFIKKILSTLPVFIKTILSNIFNPKLKTEDLDILEYQKSEDQNIKLLIAICKK
jgi:ubiquinone/menaquinone biosynthesis C-methylase UbiE